MPCSSVAQKSIATVRICISTGMKTLALREIDRHVHHDVQAAVAVGLGLLYVVLLKDERDVVLREQQVGDPVDVVHVAADHAHAGDVVQMLLGAGSWSWAGPCR